MFNIPKKKYRIYPLIVYVLRDLVLYSSIFIITYFIRESLVNSSSVVLNLIIGALGIILGSYLMISFHEWAHFIGVILGKSTVTMLPIQSLMRLFFYDFKDNDKSQNLLMMISGLVFNLLMFVPLMMILPNDSSIFIGLKIGVVLWMFEIILIELYIGWPRYTGKMNYENCYKRHTPHRKRNLYLSILAALPFVLIYIISL